LVQEAQLQLKAMKHKISEQINNFFLIVPPDIPLDPITVTALGRGV
jgi:hypothetical protein